MGGRQMSGEDTAILTPIEVRQLNERHSLVLAENGAPIIAQLHRCINGKPGARLLAGKEGLRERVALDRQQLVRPDARTAAALVAARRAGLVADRADGDA